MSKISVIGLSGESIFMKVKDFPTPSVTIHAKNCHIEPGGKGYNQAVTIRKLGSEVSYLSCVGFDQYGTYCEEYMRKLGIKTYFKKSDYNKTALATILTDETSENEVIVFPGSSNDLTEDDLESFEKEIETSDFLLMQFELPLKVIEKAIQIAKINHTKIILNPAPAKYLNFKHLDDVDIITPNEEEARLLYNIPSKIKINEFGEYLKSKVKNILIITLGKDGVLLVKDNSYQYFSSIEVKSVDTTGAGDIFNGSLAHFLSQHKTIKEAISLAIIASGLSVTKYFVMDAIPTNEEICQFQKLYNLKENK